MSRALSSVLAVAVPVLFVLEPVLLHNLVFKVLLKLTSIGRFLAYTIAMVLDLALLYLEAYWLSITDDDDMLAGFDGLFAAMVWSPFVLIILIVWIVMAVKTFRKKTTKKQEE